MPSGQQPQQQLLGASARRQRQVQQQARDTDDAADRHSRSDQSRSSRQGAYRRELDEQVHAKQQAREAEKASRRKQEKQEAAGMAAAGAGAGGLWGVFGARSHRGGGGEPLRDPAGRPVADLRAAARSGADLWGQQQAQEQPVQQQPVQQSLQQRAQQQDRDQQGLWRTPAPVGMRHASAVGQPPQRPWEAESHGSLAGHVRAGSLPVVTSAASPFPASPQPSPMGSTSWRTAGDSATPPMGHRRVQSNGPSHASLSPIHSPGQSLGPAGARRFLGALQELRPGPSEEQRRHQKAQRAKLQRDLEEQVRSKREREAQAKAKEEEEAAKEDAQIREHLHRLQTQREAERRRAQSGRGPQPGPAAMGSLQQGQLHPDTSPHKASFRKQTKRLVDAHWLDQAVSPASGAAQQQKQQAGVQPETVAPGTGATSATDSIIDLLRELRMEQARLQNEFDGQTALIHSASTAAVSDAPSEAWQELERIRKRLSDTAAEQADCMADGEDFLVSSHLLPLSFTGLPSHLAAAVAAAPPDEQGLYEPVSKVVGPPSLIRAPKIAASGSKGPAARH